MSASHKPEFKISRRRLLKQLGWTPLLFVPARLSALPFPAEKRIPGESHCRFHDLHLTPHYAAKAPIEDLLVHLLPGADEFASEKYAAQLEQIFGDWARELKSNRSSSVLGKVLAAQLQAISFSPVRDSVVRSLYGIEVRRRQFEGPRST